MEKIHLARALIITLFFVGCSSIVDSDTQELKSSNNSPLVSHLACDPTDIQNIKTISLYRCGDSGGTNHSPSTPSVVYPYNLKKKVNLRPTLSWTASDPDGDSLSYDIKLGTSSTILNNIATSVTSQTLLVPQRLSRNQNYYWQVIVKDNHNHIVTGPVWSFKTERFVDSLAYKIATE